VLEQRVFLGRPLEQEHLACLARLGWLGSRLAFLATDDPHVHQRSRLTERGVVL